MAKENGGAIVYAPTNCLSAALLEAQRHFPDIERSATAKIPTKKGGEFSYSYAPLPAILAAVRPHLAGCGLVLNYGTTREGDQVYVQARLTHVPSSETLVAELPIQIVDDWKHVGSQMTYARRYLTEHLLGIAAAEDKDAPPLPDRGGSGGQRGGRNGATGAKKDAIAYVEGKLKSAFGDGPPWEPVVKCSVVKDVWGNGSWKAFLQLPEEAIIEALSSNRHEELGGKSRFDRTVELVLAGVRRPDDVDHSEWPMVHEVPGAADDPPEREPGDEPEGEVF